MSFDELFNAFFEKPQETTFNHIEKIMEVIRNAQSIDDIENINDVIYNELGEPDNVEDLTENGIVFRKLTWYRPDGNHVEVIVSGMDENQICNITNETSDDLKSLEEQLEEAVKNEDYDLAIKLRDEINPKKVK